MKHIISILVISFFYMSSFAQNNVGIGTTTPLEKLEVIGAIKMGSTLNHYAGTLRFLNGEFQGNADGTSAGWNILNNYWKKNSNNNYFLAPSLGSAKALIGDSTSATIAKLFVKSEIVFGGTSIYGQTTKNDVTISEGFVGHQHSTFNPSFVFNYGLLGNVYDDAIESPESFGVAGNNQEHDISNYGGYFISQGFGLKNVGVFGHAANGIDNWAAILDGRTMITDKLMIGTDYADPEAKVQIMLPESGDFAHLRIEAPSWHNGFGITLKDSLHQFYIAQNLGNWDDGRFQIASDGSFNWFTMLQNGNIGLTKPGFYTPFARLQVPQNGSLNNEGGLDLNNAALYIGENQTTGMAFDENQIESVGSAINLNFNSAWDINMADGGGNVTIDAGLAKAKLHVGEGHTVLFGNDTIGKTNFYPDAKFMFKPGKGGAIRMGQLNADGSLIGGTGYNYWDDSNVGWASIAIGNNTKALGAGSLAIGIRAAAHNFGSVAIGHLSRTLGNSGIAAGYYTRADAYVSCAVGAGNVGGGNSNSWNATDPIFEVGNSIDTSNRSNALTVMKNGRVGINHHNPQSMLDIEQPNPGVGNGILLNLDGIGHWETNVDNAADYNFYFNNVGKSFIDDTDGSYNIWSDRRLKRDIESIEEVLSKMLELRPSTFQYNDVKDGSHSIGFIAQEVKPLFPSMVHEKEGYLSVNYMGFSVLAVKAIQELSGRFDELNQQVVLQQRLLEELKAELDEMKK